MISFLYLKTMKKLSILITTIPSRRDLLIRLNEALHIQICQNNLNNYFDIIICDDKIHYPIQKTIGAKRNELLELCNSEYITFFDDDDMPTLNYIKEVFKVLNSVDVDVIKINKIVSYVDNTIDIQSTNLDHTCIIKTDIAKKYLFDDTSDKEYLNWSLNVCNDIKTYVQIDEPLYIYFHNRIAQFENITPLLLVKYYLNNDNIDNLYNTIKESTKKSIWYFININKDIDFNAFKQTELYLTYKWLTFIQCDNTSEINNINGYINDITLEWKYLIVLDNNKICKINHWDRLLKENYDFYNKTDDGVIFFNDGINRSEINTYPILCKKYIENNNTILCNAYNTDFAFEEFTIVNNALGNQTYFSLVLFENTIIDKIINKADLNIFKQRKLNNFDLDKKIKLDKRPKLKSLNTETNKDKLIRLKELNETDFIIKFITRDRIIYDRFNPMPIVVNEDNVMIGNLYYNYNDIDIVE